MKDASWIIYQHETTKLKLFIVCLYQNVLFLTSPSHSTPVQGTFTPTYSVVAVAQNINTVVYQLPTGQCVPMTWFNRPDDSNNQLTSICQNDLDTLIAFDLLD